VNAQPQAKTGAPDEGALVSLYIMGKRYLVPETLTIQKALEYAGYKLVRGCGCRGGICGACGTVYRVPGSHKIEVGLACQTMVKPDMYIAQIPFFPAIKARYDLEAMQAVGDVLGQVYPELYKCMGCNTCTRTCPMDIPVMEYVSAALRGDLERCAQLSFDCVMCGLCAARCPAELVQYNIGILARRLTGRHLRPRAEHVREMAEALRAGKHEKALDALAGLSTEELMRVYSAREMEPNETGEDWRPSDPKGL
jgi:Fe-S oxidoreductase